MKKTRSFAIAVALTFCLLAFGGWTYQPEPAEVRYTGATPISTYVSSETVYFTNRVVTEFEKTDGGVPQYCQTGSIENGCGAVAGAEIVAFYDKYYANIIPNWVSYYPKTGKYKLQESAYATPLIYDLYERMRTNVDGPGATEPEVKNGLTSYINDQGYSVNYQSVVSGSSIDYAACKAAIDANKVLMLFSNAGDIYDISEGAEYDVIVISNIPAPHIMVAFGYAQFQYYNDNGLFRTDTYLLVSTGLSVLTMAYYKINPHNLNAAYIVNIA